MKRRIVALAVVGLLGLAGSSAFAFDRSDSKQPIKGTEGPDIRYVVNHPQPAKGTEGPDVRLATNDNSVPPIPEPEGPDY